MGVAWWSRLGHQCSARMRVGAVIAMNAISKRFTLFMALLACVGIALGMTASVNADPNPFGDLKCSCDQPVPGQHRHAVQQIMQGIEQGLSDPSQRSTKRSE